MIGEGAHGDGSGEYGEGEHGGGEYGMGVGVGVRNTGKGKGRWYGQLMKTGGHEITPVGANEDARSCSRQKGSVLLDKHG